MVIPHTMLAPDVLTGLIEDFVTRHGATHGHDDVSLADMIETVRLQLENEQAEITFDEESQSWTIVQNAR